MPAWCPSTPAGTTSSPSARTSEVSTPAPRGSGVATIVAADDAEPHPHPVVHAERRGELAGQPGGGPRPLPRRRAGQPGEQRLGEDVEGERGRHRVAGGAEHRRPPDDAEHHRVPGPDRDPVHREGPGRGHDPRGVVVPPGARPGDRRSAGRTAAAAAVTTAAIRSGSSGSIGRHRASQPASRACAASISELVSRISPGPGSVPIGRTSSPVGRMRTKRTPPNGQRALPRRRPLPPGRRPAAGGLPAAAARPR